jgi:Uma2 family endonuclease
MTVDEFLALPEDEVWGRELIDGAIVELGKTKVHEIVKTIANEILSHAAYKSFFVAMESMFEVPGEGGVTGLKPDLALVPRLVGGEWYPVLAVEVVSSESARRLNRKINLYFEMGAKAVWALYSDDHSITVHTPDGIARRLGRNDWLAAPGILPGLRVQVEDFFRGID